MTLDDLWALCVGEIGMSPESYLASSWREIVCTIHGYRRRIKNQIRADMARTRIAAYFSVVPHVKRGTISGPESLFKLDGDKEEEYTAFSEKDLRDLNIPEGARINHKSDMTKEEWEAKVRFNLARRDLKKAGQKNKKSIKQTK